MNIFAISGFINGISALLFGLIVYFKNPKRLSNQIFGLMTFSLAIWSFGYGFWLTTESHESALFWTKILSIGSTFIPIFFLHWVFILLGLNKKREKTLVSGYIITLIFLLFSFSSLYIKDVTPRLSFSWWPVPGIAYSFYLFFGYIGMVGYACYELIKCYRTTGGYLKEQIKYILVAILVGFGGGATNFPLWYGVPLPPYGNFLVFLYPFILSYAILKYRLMDIRLVLGRWAIYILSFVTVMILAFLLMFLINKFFGVTPLVH